VPNGAIGQKPYALLQRTLAEKNLSAIARVTIAKRERLVRLRADDRLLVMARGAF